MPNNTPKITLENIKSFLDEYGWHYKETKSEDGSSVILTNYKLNNINNGILISFSIVGEYLLVSTVNFISYLNSDFTRNILELNDVVKMVKLFSVSSNGDSSLNVEMGFELWEPVFEKNLFFGFLDMLGYGIEYVHGYLKENNVDCKTNYVVYR